MCIRDRTLINGGTYFGPGASFQYGFNENLVAGFNFDYQFGSGGIYLMNFEPRIDYYLNSAYNGFHVGSNFGYVISGFSTTIPGFGTVSGSAGEGAIGAGAGYAHPLSDNIFIDVSAGGSYFLTSKAFAVRPTLTFGYKFGGK